MGAFEEEAFMSSINVAERLLTAGLKKLGIDCSIDSYMQYLQLLQTWNRTYNLTAIRDLEAMVTRHVLDSLAILPWIVGNNILDVGSGAGLPGIPIALARSDLHIVLLDSNGKKTRFLQEVRRILNLPNIDIVQARAEDYHTTILFDTIMSRAFTQLPQMLAWTQHLLKPNGIWLAMKGVYPAAELASIDVKYDIKPYAIDGVEEERCVCIMHKEHTWLK